MSDTRKEYMEMQEQWNKEEKDRVIKLQRRLLWAGVIIVYSGVAFIVWLALQLKGIVG